MTLSSEPLLLTMIPSPVVAADQVAMTRQRAADRVARGPRIDQHAGLGVGKWVKPVASVPMRLPATTLFPGGDSGQHDAGLAVSAEHVAFAGQPIPADQGVGAG